jgi:hypothetical protein
MYPVTHMTIAAGSVWIGAKVWRRLRGNSPALDLDYRFAALRSQVPDLIDKPLARWGPDYFGYTATSGHTIGHTLLLSFIIIIIGILLARRGETRAPAGRALRIRRQPVVRSLQTPNTRHFGA